MSNSKFKKLSFGFVFILILTLVLIGNSKTSLALNEISENESNQMTLIKTTIEQFIKDDYNFNGGKNDFSTIGNEDLKKYLIARNDYKHFNNKENNSDYTPFNERFTFHYKDISDVDKKTKKVIVDVDEIFDYTMIENGKLETTKNAGAGNLYVIYISNFGDDKWKIMSATIDVDVDPIDADYNVNVLLGYDKKKRTKRSESINIDDALNSIKTRKENLAEDLNKNNLDPEVDKNLPQELKGKLTEEMIQDLNLDFKYSKDPDIVEDYVGQKKTRTKRSTSINRNAIYNYASRYNEKSVNSSNSRNPSYLSFKADCANYASQALRYAGGTENNGNRIYIDGKYRTWSMTPDSLHLKRTYGDAWAQAHYLRAFIVRNQNGVTGPGGYAIKYGSTLQLGDLTFIHNKDRWFHTFIVTKPGANFKIAAHTKDRWNDPINSVAPESTYQRSYIHISSLN